ncbi:NYN domain protein [Caprobacter fermentans]|uniref:NYN domain protein n=1 Tax=Caproicibacter fermentans TaxID=2576756 RepID=A0A6N8I1A6_9FIRM|nr:NYN domain-containing protein [Caproicibacter fermentans]MVB11530.1 NYN domain protein [Caproicibacter fermentans]OCN02725.1 Maebl [Clostridium sp. W14A]QNK41049.1 NYN domain-containing protein [Caproicibacter fermentans]
MADEKRFAVLIDADNVSEKYVKFILDEISNDGIATIKRIYGDWTKPTMSSWKNVLLDNSITPIQQYGYTTGKNATDSAMIIDAMDILYAGNIEGFSIVSSDSDFTRLASRLRESGMYVVGMGEKKTPNAFIAACNKFKYLEILAQTPILTDDQPSEAAVEQVSGLDHTSLNEVRNTIRTIVDETSDDDGWAALGDVGNILNKRYPDFDVRNYGFKKLTPFINSLKVFEIRCSRSKDGHVRLIFVREKGRRGSKS